MEIDPLGLQDDWRDDPEIRRRIGRFNVAREIQEDFGWRVIHMIQSACIVKFMDRCWDVDATTWYALNPQFDIVQEGTIIPWYELIVEAPEEDDNTMSFRWERRDDSHGEPRA